MINTSGKKYGVFGKHTQNTRIQHFDQLEMAWHQLQTNIVTLVHLTRVVLWMKRTACNVWK